MGTTTTKASGYFFVNSCNQFLDIETPPLQPSLIGITVYSTQGKVLSACSALSACPALPVLSVLSVMSVMSVLSVMPVRLAV